MKWTNFSFENFISQVLYMFFRSSAISVKKINNKIRFPHKIKIDSQTGHNIFVNKNVHFDVIF